MTNLARPETADPDDPHEENEREALDRVSHFIKGGPKPVLYLPSDKPRESSRSAIEPGTDGDLGGYFVDVDGASSSHSLIPGRPPGRTCHARWQVSTHTGDSGSWSSLSSSLVLEPCRGAVVWRSHGRLVTPRRDPRPIVQAAVSPPSVSSSYWSIRASSLEGHNDHEQTAARRFSARRVGLELKRMGQSPGRMATGP